MKILLQSFLVFCCLISLQGCIDSLEDNTLPDRTETASVAIEFYSETDSIALPNNSINLIGSFSSAIDSIQWSKSSGPATFTIESPTALKTTISNLIEGTYRFRLYIKGTSGKVRIENYTIIVAPEITTEYFTAAVILTLPTNYLQLAGTSTGDVISINWVKSVGSASYSIESPNELATKISNLVQGTYEFTLTITGIDKIRYETYIIAVVPPSEANANQIIINNIPSQYIYEDYPEITVEIHNAPAVNYYKIYVRNNAQSDWIEVMPFPINTLDNTYFVFSGSDIFVTLPSDYQFSAPYPEFKFVY